MLNCLRYPVLLILLFAAASCSRPSDEESSINGGSRVAIVSLDPADASGWSAFLRDEIKSGPHYGPAQVEQALGDALRDDRVLVVAGVEQADDAWVAGVEPYLQAGGRLVYCGAEPFASVEPPPDVPMMSPPGRRYATTCSSLRDETTGSRLQTAGLACQSPVSAARGWGGRLGAETRWIPLVTALDDRGDPVGWPVSMWVGPGESGAMAYGWVAVNPLRDARAAAAWCLQRALEEARKNHFLIQAGSARHAFTEGEPIVVEGRWVSRHAPEASFRIAAALVEAGGRVVRRVVSPPSTDRGEGIRLPTGMASIPGSRTTLATLRVRLRDADDSRTLDELNQVVSILPRQPDPADMEPVTVSGGSLRQGRRSLVINGLNYWPVCLGSAPSTGPLPHWLDPARFDGPAVMRDLDRIQEAGFNAIALQLMHPDQVPQFRFVMEELRRRNLWAMVYVNGLDPYFPRLEDARLLIRAAGLAAWPNLLTVETAWRPVVDTRSVRERLSAQWRSWLSHHFGTPAAAARVLHVTDRPFVSGWPDMPDLENHEHGSTVLDLYFHRFLIDMADRGSRTSVQLCRGEGVTVPLTARLTAPVKPADDADLHHAPAPQAGSAFLDLVSVDGWGIGPDRTVETADRILRYARGMSGGKPVMLTEWGREVVRGDAGSLARQEVYYDAVYQAIEQTAAAGSFVWWYPGGCRFGPAGRDFGLTHPDGRWRRAVDAVRRFTNRSRNRNPVVEPWRGAEQDPYHGMHLFRQEMSSEDVRMPTGEIRPAGWKETSLGLMASLDRPFKSRPEHLDLMNAAWGEVLVDGHARLVRYGDPITVEVGNELTLQAVNTGSVAWDAGGRIRDGEVAVRVRTPEGLDEIVSVKTNPGDAGRQATLRWTPARPGLWEISPVWVGRGSFGETLRVEVAASPQVP